MKAENSKPRVSIGLPVYNGERYVAAAIESILAQTYENFELIISDNASIDRTEDICRHYAERDARVRYYRQPVNLGAAANFNRVFELAKGSNYFKWAAHDDMLAPTFLEKCVAALEASPDAVLCYPGVQEIDEMGKPIAIQQSRFLGADARRVSDRFAAVVLNISTCREIFGVIRSESLRRTSLHQPYQGEDKVLLAELVLFGRFLEVAEPLFLHREHPTRFTVRVKSGGFDVSECQTWYDPRAPRKRMPYCWIQYMAYWNMARKNVADMPERFRCYAHLLLWLGATRNGQLLNARRLACQGMEAVNPRLPPLLRSLKRGLLSTR